MKALLLGVSLVCAASARAETLGDLWRASQGLPPAPVVWRLDCVAHAADVADLAARCGHVRGTMVQTCCVYQKVTTALDLVEAYDRKHGRITVGEGR